MTHSIGMAWIVATLTLAAGPATAGRPAQGSQDAPASFDCGRAASRVERLVCSEDGLRRADARLGDAYARLLRHSLPAARPAIRQGQRVWLTRRDACATTDCLSGLYEARETSLGSALNRRDTELRRGLARIGQCQVTAIEEIGPRLEGSDRPDDTGTSVGFENGVYQVSYDLERPVARSRVGDPARVCLASIPRHCPPGDDRGREYDVTNLRTGEKWRMPDSQHMCGGA